MDFDKELIQKLLTKYPGRIPVYIHKDPTCKVLQDIPKNKYLVPYDMYVSQLIFIIRNAIKLSPDKAIFVFVNNKMVHNNTLIGELYENSVIEIVYRAESVFG